MALETLTQIGGITDIPALIFYALKQINVVYMFRTCRVKFRKAEPLGYHVMT